MGFFFSCLLIIRYFFTVDIVVRVLFLAHLWYLISDLHTAHEEYRVCTISVSVYVYTLSH